MDFNVGLVDVAKVAVVALGAAAAGAAVKGCYEFGADMMEKSANAEDPSDVNAKRAIGKTAGIAVGLGISVALAFGVDYAVSYIGDAMG